MIFWKDFILDDVVGPSLFIGSEDFVNTSVKNSVVSAAKNFSEEASHESCRGKRFGGSSDMEVASGAQIQETRQEQKPARMVGFSGLESHKSARVGMDANLSDRTGQSRQEEEEA